MNALQRQSARTALLLALSLLLAQHSYGLPRVDMARQTVIAERTSKAGVRIVLAVDRDDVVHEIGIGLPDTKGEPEIESNLGTRVMTSGSLVLTSLLPKDKVATMARRVTLDSGVTIHVVVAWGFSEYPDLLRPYSHLYFFREDHGEVELDYDEGLGSQLEQLVVEDINQDGKAEVLAATSENAVDLMYVWQIQPDATVKEIQRIEGYSVHTLADKFIGPDEGIVVESKADSCRPGRVSYDVEEYLWSAKEQKFVKTTH